MPEGRWFWRRLYVFGSSAGAWLVLNRLVPDLPAQAGPRIAQGLMGLLALTMIVYLVAPTAQQLGSGLGAFLRSGRS